MSIEIEIVTGDASWPSVKPLFDLVWPPEVIDKLAWRHTVFAYPELRVIVEDDGQPVCHVGLYRREGMWKGRATRIGGVGGVITHPDYRKRGLASVALTAALHTLKDERATDFALLFCEPHNLDFYTRRNWKPFIGEVYAEQHGERVRFDVMTPLVSYLKRAPHEGEMDLCGLPW
ncbi:GNAT family N-acetyltransferase [Tardiphaga sp. P9-11]|jgi:GNAT superfamily N-acetyltransferase|uniref:GNAT family N-acetyltransferase n=1 Tax=Tardiphaga sp. P9-11 TaxID=2024614 RepID=UPI0011F2DF50|nr:GNAT family N-acetyltransferase [Tardiphaga sp. P9-11]KAA0073844.1 GNAT family N-acetyltransferase [Tardiphaga sp. P9-11]